jgi:hypothetical protein
LTKFELSDIESVEEDIESVSDVKSEIEENKLPEDYGIKATPNGKVYVRRTKLKLKYYQ